MTDKAKTDSRLTKAPWMALWGFVLGALFPLTAWYIDFDQMGIDIIPFSFNSLRVVHLANPLHFMIDLVPFILAGTAYLLALRVRLQNERMMALIRHQSENVSKLALFAEKIGEGDFDAQYDVTDKNDSLGQALLTMRTKLLHNKTQDANKAWIATGRDRVATLLREQNNIDSLAELVINQLVHYAGAVQGGFYLMEEEDDTVWLRMKSSYAYNRKKYLEGAFKLGQGLVGEAAVEQSTIHRTEVPDSYVTITSGLLGDRKPQALLIVPLVAEDMLQGAIELASFERFTPLQIEFVEEVATIIARTLFNLKTTERTSYLLAESQQMTRELREQQSLLEANAIEMQAKQEEIANSNVLLEEQIGAVKNSQLRQHALLENASELITIYDEGARVKYQSPSILSILGYNEEELVGQNDFHKADERGQVALREMFRQLIDTPNKPLSIEFPYQKKNGEKVWLEATARNLLNDPAINGIILNSRDITHRRKAEQEQIMRGKMQALSENSRDMIIRFDLEGQFLYVNPRIYEYTGLRKNQVLNHKFAELEIDSTIQNQWSEVLEKTSNTRKLVEQEMDFPTTRKGDRVMQVTAIPEFGEGDVVDSVLVVSHDITARKKQEVLIRETNKKITDSINYAQRLQKAIVPDNQFVSKFLPESYIFYRPKDVVSGDFPYFYEKGDLLYMAAVDCTGHGVPGAMLSLIGFSVLNEILGHDRVYNAAEVLDLMHQGVVKTLKQDHADNVKTADGMDVALVRIDRKKNEVSFSGAHRPLYLVTGDELVQYKGDRYPIGGTQYKRRKPFTNFEFKVNEGDAVHFFSDGLPDQFGGPDKNKYGPKRIREKLLESRHLPMEAIHDLFENEYQAWKGDLKQLDDLLMIGIRF